MIVTAPRRVNPYLSRTLCAPSISPLRALAIGLSPADVCAWYRLTHEQLDELTQANDDKKLRRQRQPDTARPGALMTRLLLRPDMDEWETKTAERL